MEVKRKRVANVPNLRFPGFDGEWNNKKLDDVSIIGRGKSKHRPRDADFLFGGKYPFIQTGDIRKASLYLEHFTQTYSEAGLKQSKLWNEGTLCVTIAANIAETAILKIQACFPDSIIGMIPVDGQTTSLFLKHSFDKFKIKIQTLSQGAAQDNLNQEKLSNIEFSFPHIDEQLKLTAFLSLIDDRIETQSKIIEDLETQFKNLVIKLLSSEITFKDKNGKDYPKWEIEKLGNIATFRRGSFPQPYGLPKWYDQAEGFPFIQVFDVGENMRLKNKTKNKISQLATEQSVFAKKGTLILTIQGSIGRVAKTDFDAYIDRTLLIFQSFQRDINIDFFKYAIFLLFEVEKEKAPGGIIKTITKEVLTQFTVPVPSYDEQTKIAEVFTLMESKLEVEKKILSSYKYQKQHILSNLFI